MLAKKSPRGRFFGFNFPCVGFQEIQYFQRHTFFLVKLFLRKAGTLESRPRRVRHVPTQHFNEATPAISIY